MKPLIVILLTFLTISCRDSNPKPITNENKLELVEITNDTTIFEDTIQIAFIDTIQVPTVDTIITAFEFQIINDSISPFVEQHHLDSIQSALLHRKNINNATDLFNYYTKSLPNVQEAVMHGMGKSHPDVVYSGETEPATAWQFISILFPELDAQCLCAECSSEAHIRIDKMYKLAKLTPNQEDDDYFYLTAKVYGDYWTKAEIAHPVYEYDMAGFYTADHCCVCAFNSMGNGFYFNTLEYAFNKEWNIYQSRVESIKQSGFLHDHGYNFYFEKEAVLEELEKMKILPLPDDFMKGIKDLIKRIEEDREIYFGCQDINNQCPMG